MPSRRAIRRGRGRGRASAPRPEGVRPTDPERSINGMFSFTPDAGSIVVSRPRSGACGSARPWVTHAGGFGKHVAEWMVRRALDRHGGGGREPLLSVHGDAALRARTRSSSIARSTTSSIRASRWRARVLWLAVLRPPCGSRRRVRRRRRLGASRVVRGQRFADPERCAMAAPGRVGCAVLVADRGRRAPGHALERGALRPGRRSRSSTSRVPTRPAYLERICANRIDRPVGTIVYTAMLTPTGGIRCDLTITRKEGELFRVITGGGSGQHDLAWMRRQVGEGERVRSPSAPGRCSRSARGGRTRARSRPRSPTWTWATTRSRT